MQIQDNQRPAKPQTDSRASHRERFSPFGRVEAGSADDLFAQIFQEIAAIQSPSGSPQPEESLAPQETLEEVASRSQDDEPAAVGEEGDTIDDRELENTTVVGILPVSPLPVPNEPVAEQVSVADDAESAITLATVNEGESGSGKQKLVGEPFEAVVAGEPRATELKNEALTKPVEASDLADAEATGVESELSLETASRDGDAQAGDSSEVTELLSDSTERLASDEKPRVGASEEEALSAQATASQSTSDPASRDRRDRRGRGRESDVRAATVKAASQPSDVRADAAAALGASKPEAAQAFDLASTSSVSSDLAASGLPAASPVAMPLVAPEAVASASMAAASAIAGTGASGNSGAGNSGASDNSVAGDSSRATSAALGGVAPSGSDAGEVAAGTAKPAEGRGDVADRARLVHRIAKAFQRMGVDGGQVRLRMHPDDLGSVQLDMQISGRKVSATVTADNEEARLLLQSSLPELRQRLESQGLTVERLEVEKRAEEENRGFSNRDPSHQQSGYEHSSGRRDDVWGRSTLARANSIAANRRDYGPETAVQGVSAPLAVTGGVPLNRSLDLQL